MAGVRDVPSYYPFTLVTKYSLLRTVSVFAMFDDRRDPLRESGNQNNPI